MWTSHITLSGHSSTCTTYTMRETRSYERKAAVLAADVDDAGAGAGAGAGADRGR